jgi:drug/metabolite transporter (DMT)-like permease
MNTTFLAFVIVLCTGVFWGVCWFPVRAIAELGLDGAWGTGAINLAAMLFLLPFLLAKTHVFRNSGFGVDVARRCRLRALRHRVSLRQSHAVRPLWFFSPIWSVLIANFVLRWQVPTLRLVAIGMGLVRLFIMLGGEGDVPVPHSLGEWMAFIGGLIWADATAGIRLKSRRAAAACGISVCLGRDADLIRLRTVPCTPAHNSARRRGPHRDHSPRHGRGCGGGCRLPP